MTFRFITLKLTYKFEYILNIFYIVKNLPNRPLSNFTLVAAYIASNETIWKTLFTVLFVPTIRMYFTTLGSKYKYCQDRQKYLVCSMTRTQSF